MNVSTGSTDRETDKRMAVAGLLLGLLRLALELGWRWEEGRGWVRPGEGE